MSGGIDAIERNVDPDGWTWPNYPSEVVRHHRVYFIRAGENGPVKIGFSTDIAQRVRDLQTASPHELKVEAVVIGTQAVEAWFHRLLRKWHIRGEWFALSDDLISYALGCMVDEGLVWM